jgi:hypothetical protein
MPQGKVMDARRRHKAAIRSLKRIEDWLATDPPMTDDINLVGGVIDAADQAVQATSEILRANGARLKQQLAQARKDLDERGGHVERMDIVDLGIAADAGLISREVYEKERERRAKNLSRPAVHRTSSTPPTGGAVITGHMPCAEPGCWTVIDLSKNGSGYCAEHVHLEPRTFITGTFGVRNLDDLLYDAEREHERATRELRSAEKQLTAARAAIERFDAQHRG